MAYQGAPNLGEIVGQAQAIQAGQTRYKLAQLALEAQQREATNTRGIQETLANNQNATSADFAKYGTQGLQAYNTLNASKLEDLTNHLKEQYIRSGIVASSEDPVAAAKQYAPDFIAHYDQVHGPGSFEQLTPDQVKQGAIKMNQETLQGLQDPQKAAQNMFEIAQAHYKQQGPGGDLQRAQLTQAGEDKRAAASNAITLRGQNLANSRDLKPVLQPDGTVTYVQANDAAGQPVGSTSTMGGGRLQTMFSRVSGAGNEVAQAVHNISRLPSGSSSGLLGIGSSPGHGMLATTKAALANTLSSQDTQRYNVMVSGIQRNLASIEAAGLNPGETLTSGMSSIVLKPGDTEMTKLTKMAEIRQITEKGLEGYLVNPAIPKQQKEQVQKIISQIQQAVPYTQDDITDLMEAKNPNTTIQDIVRQKGLGTSTPGGPVKISSDADYAKLPSGSQYIAPDGSTRTKR